jgi:peroxiredoxin
VTETDPGPREGQRVRDLELPAEDGRAFHLYERLAERPLILVLYRGDC